MQAVIHVSDRDRVARALGNAANLLGSDTNVENVVVVANGDAVVALRASDAHDSRIADLLAEGLTVRACRNSLRRSDIPADSLVDGVETVPSGVVHVVSLQDDGWSYVKP